MNKKRIGWFIAVIIGLVITIIMLGLFIIALSENAANKKIDETMNIDKLSAYCYRASELYCASIFYTEKAFTMDPQDNSYDNWVDNQEKAKEYWDALDEVLDIIIDYVESDEFDSDYEDMALDNKFIDRLFSQIFIEAQALDSTEIIKTFDSAKAGQKIKAVASLLGSDMKYAYSAFKVANGEITAQNWNDFGDTALRYEQAAQVMVTAGKGAAVYVGAATGGAATVLGKTVLAINGASAIWQAGDNVAFIAIGDNYKSNEFVINLNNVSDAVAPIAFVGDMLTMDFTSGVDKIMSTVTVVDTIRGLFQDNKIAGIQLTGIGGSITTLTKQELLDYQLARENGQNLPKEIEDLLATLYDKPEELKELIDFKVIASKKVLKPEEWVTFKVEDTEDKYSYVWKYGGNENKKKENIFEYMYQVAGEYTMRVTILDEKGNTIGEGSCSIVVKEEPEEIEDINEQYPKNLDVFIGDWYASGAITSIDDISNRDIVLESISGMYLSIYEDGTVEQVERQYLSDGTIKNNDTLIANLFYDYDIESHMIKGFVGGDKAYEIFILDGYIYLAMIDADIDTPVYFVFSRRGQEDNNLDIAGDWKSINDGSYMIRCNEVGGYTTIANKSGIGLNEYSAKLNIKDNGDYIFTYAENYPNEVKWSTFEGNGLQYSDIFTMLGLTPVKGSDGYLYLPASGGEGYYIFK